MIGSGRNFGAQGKQLIQSGVGPGGKFFESLFEPGVWIHAVELGCSDQGLDGSGGHALTIQEAIRLVESAQTIQQLSQGQAILIPALAGASMRPLPGSWASAETKSASWDGSSGNTEERPTPTRIAGVIVDPPIRAA